VSDTIIQVNNLTKEYRLGNIGIQSLLDDLKVVVSKVGFPIRPPDKRNSFTALKDVTFSVSAGEVLGIIGHNGAGKSTLLKILSRITEPTSGEAIIMGRVASLLEVGTGFHGEMTGRENIYLNGSLYGLTRKEISTKLKSIIEFSEVGKFIDTPVKRYSSGMYVRLAFAVAAHLQPEILIVDEVLAVGDANFQKKCIDKMKEVSLTGRTILFVSHNLQTIRSLCTQCIVLKEGEISFIGETHNAINHYIANNNVSDRLPGRVNFNSKSSRYGTGEIRISSIEVRNSKKELTGVIKYKESFTINLVCKINKPVEQITFFIYFTDMEDRVTGLCYSCDQIPNLKLDGEHCNVELTCKNKFLPGEHYIRPSISDMQKSLDQIERAMKFKILRNSGKDEKSYPLEEAVRGHHRVTGNWALKKKSDK
jgi:lipopolysaccharide transport system ATP-binding protein